MCVPRVDPRAFDTWFRNRGVSRVFVMEAFIGQDVDYVMNMKNCISYFLFSFVIKF